MIVFFANELVKRLFIAGWLSFLSYLLTLFVISFLPMLFSEFSWLKDFKDIDHQIGVVISVLVFWWYWKVTRKNG